MKRGSLIIGTTIGLTLSSLGLSGAAAVTTEWTQLGQDMTSNHSNFGNALAVSSDGTRVVVGAPGAAAVPDPYTEKGEVRLYELQGSTWEQLGTTLTGAAIRDRFGYSVDISSDGSRIAVGAPSNDTGGTDRGQVSVYDWDGTSWTQVGSNLTGGADDDEFGSSIALSNDGSRVAVGAPGHSSDTGRVQVYELSGSSWAQLGSNLDGDAADDLFGSAVALSGDGSRIAIGAPDNGIDNTYKGQVRVFDWNGTNWTQVGADINGSSNSRIGTSVALSDSGNRLAAGAPNTFDSSQAGLIRVYDWNGSAWTQVGSDLTGLQAGDEFGQSVSLSSNGSRVLGSAPYAGSGVNAYARVLQLSGGVWEPVDSVIGTGDPAVVNFGYSTGISANGSRIAIGGGSIEGIYQAVRVFESTASPGDSFAEFTYRLPDGRECTSISPQRVIIGTVQALPGREALCQTSDGSLVAGWVIPVPEGFTGAGSPAQPFNPGHQVYVSGSQQFTLVPFEQVLTITYDSNVAAGDECAVAEAANAPHASADGREMYVWVPRDDFGIARTPTEAPCAPDGHMLTGWNTRGDGTGDSISMGAELPQSWHTSTSNEHRFFAVWEPSPAID